VSDKSLQAIQDVIRAPWYQYENSSRGSDFDTFKDQLIINMIPEKSIDFATETAKTQLVKRPGFLSTGTDFLTGLVTNPASCSIRDFICVTALFDVFVLAVFDEIALKFFLIQVRPVTGTSALLGSITAATNDFIYLSEISQTSAGSLVPGVGINVVKHDYTSSAGYYLISSAGTMSGVLHNITDTGYPANQTPALIPVGKFINQRGTFYIATLDGTIWNSYAGQNDISAWKNGTLQIGSIKTNIYPDQLLGLERFKNNIVAFSRNSLEFFQEVGAAVNNPSTLAPLDQAFIKFGAVKQELIKNVDDVLYWVAFGQDGQTGLWRLDGYTPTKLSTPYIDAQIAQTATNLNTYSFNLQSCVMNGKRQIFVNGLSSRGMLTHVAQTSFSNTDTYQIDTLFDSQSSAFVYNVEDKTWWGFASDLDNGNAPVCTPMFATSFASPVQGNLYVQYAFLNTATLAVSPNIFRIRVDNIYSDDVSTSIVKPVYIYAQTNSFWFDNEKRKRISKFKVICNTVPILASGDTSTYAMYLIYNKDNSGQPDASVNFTNTFVRRIVNPPPQGRIVFNNLGMARVWDFAIIEKSKMNLRLAAFEVDIQQGSH